MDKCHSVNRNGARCKNTAKFDWSDGRYCAQHDPIKAAARMAHQLETAQARKSSRELRWKQLGRVAALRKEIADSIANRFGGRLGAETITAVFNGPDISAIIELRQLLEELRK